MHHHADVIDQQWRAGGDAGQPGIMIAHEIRQRGDACAGAGRRPLDVQRVGQKCEPATGGECFQRRLLGHAAAATVVADELPVRLVPLRQLSGAGIRVECELPQPRDGQIAVRAHQTHGRVGFVAMQHRGACLANQIDRQRGVARLQGGKGGGEMMRRQREIAMANALTPPTGPFLGRWSALPVSLLATFLAQFDLHVVNVAERRTHQQMMNCLQSRPIITDAMRAGS